MRNIKIYSALGSMIEVGTARVMPNTPTVIQEDQLTPQAMQKYGDYIATASLDNVVEHVGMQVNKAFLRESFGWVEGEEARQKAVKEAEKAKDEDTGGEGEVPESPEPEPVSERVEAPPEDSTPGTAEPPKEEEPAEGSAPEEPPVEEAPKEEYDPFEEKKEEPKKKKAAKKKPAKKKKAAKKKKKS